MRLGSPPSWSHNFHHRSFYSAHHHHQLNNRSKMKAAPSFFILATAVPSIFKVVAWNDNSSNSNCRFGVVNNRIKNKNHRQIVSQSAQSFATSVEQQQYQPSFSSSTTAEIMGMPVHEDESPTNTSFVESTSEYYPSRRIVADGARAMAVAVVSAAAIGGARHAIELIAV